METKQTYADRLEEAHEHARWSGHALCFLAEVVGGRSVLPDTLSEGARLGLGVFLEECARRTWEAEAVLGVVTGGAFKLALDRRGAKGLGRPVTPRFAGDCGRESVLALIG